MPFKIEEDDSEEEEDNSEEEERPAVVMDSLQEKEKFSFLPIIHDIMKSMEKDSQEVHQELSRLKTRIGEVRTTVASMPGIDTNPEEQRKLLKHLEDQVQSKQQLLHKYKMLGVFEIPK
uniref:mediator of RNA polymerase II transcription subunit 9 n=1 Tax=Myxine glutinosa TaxID=7769 RepID=UPI00358E230C